MVSTQFSCISLPLQTTQSIHSFPKTSIPIFPGASGVTTSYPLQPATLYQAEITVNKTSGPPLSVFPKPLFKNAKM